ncbi:hydantoinase/oxoprolinase N-terminal domain-containing protein [Saccharopolyspora sp. NPDC003752]
MIIGVEVGPASTNAVLLAGGATTVAEVPSIADDVVGSVAAALRALPPERTRARQVAIGLRVAETAVARREALAKVGVVRIGGAADAVRPMFGWPEDLHTAVCAGAMIVDGWAGLDPAERAPLDRDAVARFGARMAGTAEAFAVCGVFSPADSEQEHEAAELLRREAGDVHVALAGEFGSLGLIERENTTVLDAALSRLTTELCNGLERALAELGMRAATVLVPCGDGTLTSLDYLRRQPGLSLGSGPASILRGAGVLAGLSDAIVADTGAHGACSARIGALIAHYPQESGPGERIGGVPVCFRMPDLIPVDGPAPQQWAEAVDRMQPAAGRLPIVIVGAGEAPARIPGVAEIVRPEHGGVAGAVGAATSPVGGQCERIVRLGPRTRVEAALDDVREGACARAVRAGADPRQVQIVSVDRAPLPYLQDTAVRLRARAAGPPLPARTP